MNTRLRPAMIIRNAQLAAQAAERIEKEQSIYFKEGPLAYHKAVMARSWNALTKCPICGKKSYKMRSGFCKAHVPIEVKEHINARRSIGVKLHAPICQSNGDPRKERARINMKAGSIFNKQGAEKAVQHHWEQERLHNRIFLNYDRRIQEAQTIYITKGALAYFHFVHAGKGCHNHQCPICRKKVENRHGFCKEHLPPFIYEEMVRLQTTASKEAMPQRRPPGDPGRESWRVSVGKGAKRFPKNERSLIALGLPFVQKANIELPYYDATGKLRGFSPDFLIKNRLIEYKGDQFLREYYHGETRQTTSKLIQTWDMVGFVPYTMHKAYEYCLAHPRLDIPGYMDPLLLARACFQVWVMLGGYQNSEVISRYSRRSMSHQESIIIEALSTPWSLSKLLRHRNAVIS